MATRDRGCKQAKQMYNERLVCPKLRRFFVRLRSVGDRKWDKALRLQRIKGNAAMSVQDLNYVERTSSR